MIIAKIAFCIAAAGAAGYAALSPEPAPRPAPVAAVPAHHPPAVDLGRLADAFRR